MKKILLLIQIILLCIIGFNLYRTHKYNEQTRETLKQIEILQQNEQHRKHIRDSLQIERIK